MAKPKFTLKVKAHIPHYGTVDTKITINQTFFYMDNGHIIQLSIEKDEKDGVQVRRVAYHPDRPFGNDPEQWGHNILKPSTILQYWKQRIVDSMLPAGLKSPSIRKQLGIKRLVKFAKEQNKGTTYIVNFLNNHGFKVENKPTACITPKMRELFYRNHDGIWDEE